MGQEPKPHWSMESYKDNPIVLVGDTVRLVEEGQWTDGHGGAVFVPAGTLARVEAWRFEGVNGIALRFQNFTHPVYQVFPMSQHRPGLSRYSDKFTLISRTAHDQADDGHPPLPRSRLQEPPEGLGAFLPRRLGHGPADDQAQGHQRPAQGARKPGAQGRGKGGPAGRPGAPQPNTH